MTRFTDEDVVQHAEAILMAALEKTAGEKTYINPSDPRARVGRVRAFVRRMKDRMRPEEVLNGPPRPPGMVRNGGGHELAKIPGVADKLRARLANLTPGQRKALLAGGGVAALAALGGAGYGISRMGNKEKTAAAGVADGVKGRAVKIWNSAKTQASTMSASSIESKKKGKLGRNGTVDGARHGGGIRKSAHDDEAVALLQLSAIHKVADALEISPEDVYAILASED